MKSKKSTDIRDKQIIKSDLEEFVGYNLKRAYMLVRSDFRTSMGKDGLSPTSLSVLSAVVQMPQITQSELAKQLGIERSGLVSIIDDLESRTYVARTPVPGDRRIQALVPLPKGKSAYKQTLKRVRAHEEALFTNISAAEKKQLLVLLRKIRETE